MARWMFWGAALLLLHTYFFYPVILLLLDLARRAIGRLPPAADDQPFGPEADYPCVTLIVAAYNEASCIEEKIRNSLQIDYPADRFELLIGSDGSTDGTDEIVRRHVDGPVRFWRGERAGKASVLNACVPAASSGIVVLSDANTMIDAGAVKRLVRHFEDSEIGAVCGKLRLYNRTRREYEESAYWTYESWIKAYEGKLGAVMGANGGLYAIRRRLFTPLPRNTIVDDFVIATRIIEQGFKMVYDAGAVAHEETTEDYEKEFKRRTRIAAGNFQSLTLVPHLLSPGLGFRAFAFWSHKVLRWFAPGLMAVAFAANLLLIARPLYAVLFAGQVLFYGLAFAGREKLLEGRLARIASVAYYFVTMNVALAVGFWRFACGVQGATWERTARIDRVTSPGPRVTATGSGNVVGPPGSVARPLPTSANRLAD